MERSGSHEDMQVEKSRDDAPRKVVMWPKLAHLKKKVIRLWQYKRELNINVKVYPLFFSLM